MRKRERLAGANVLRRAVDVMNQGGRHWTKSELRSRTVRVVWNEAYTKSEKHKVEKHKVEPRYCAVGGIEHVLGILDDADNSLGQKTFETNGRIGGNGSYIGCYPPRGRAALLLVGEHLGVPRAEYDTDDTYLVNVRRRLISANDSGDWDTIRALLEASAALA